MLQHEASCAAGLDVTAGPRLRLLHRATQVALDEEGDVSVGRDPECSLSIADHLVSRLHSMIEATEDGQRVLRDLGSTNGTYLNGLRLSAGETFPLREHDVIEVGAEHILVAAAEGSPRVSPTPQQSGSDHDLTDLVRDGLIQVPAVEMVALQRAVEAAVGRAGLDDALALLSARVGAKVGVLFRRGADGATTALAAHPAAVASGGSIGVFSRSGLLAALASRALVEGRGILMQGLGRPDEGGDVADETSVHLHWSAAAVPLDRDRAARSLALVVGRPGRNGLDRRDLAVLAALSERVAAALRGLAAPTPRALAARQVGDIRICEGTLAARPGRAP